MALLRRRKENPEGRMSLGEHFREFRNRATVAALAVVAGAVVGWIQYEHIWKRLTEPLDTWARERGLEHLVSANFNDPTQAVGLQLKISLFVGIILASPVWLWEVWAFLVPGLTKKEKKVARLFIGSAVPLFLFGCLAGALAITNVLRLLYGFTPENATNIVDGPKYADFVTKFILTFGLAFLMPVFLMALNGIRILPGRVMLKGWRIAIVAIFLFAAMMTPTPDAWTMVALALPMTVLYYAACWLAILLDKRREKNNRPDWMDVADDEASTI